MDAAFAAQKELKMNEKVVDIYCDEIKERTQISIDGKSHKWMYIGILIVPTSQKISFFNDLMTCRCGNPQPNNWDSCINECKYHKKNGIEVHYNQLRSMDKYFIAKKWTHYFINDTKNTFFYMLGIETTKINNDYFGNVSGVERFERMYNRFFRMAIQKSLKSFFTEFDTIKVRKIFHDKADVSNNDKFPWHICKILPEIDSKIIMENNEIIFIDSDHVKSQDKNSHFIQYTDLLLGLFYNSFHGESEHQNVDELSTIIHPFTHRLITAPSNRNSSYKYYKRIAIDFFPKHEITSEENLENEYKRMDSFYKNREIVITKKGQQELF